MIPCIDLLELAAAAAADIGRPSEAARLIGAAEAQRNQTGYTRPAPSRAELLPVISEIEAALGAEPYARAVAEGRLLSLKDAVAYAAPRPRDARPSPLGLGKPHTHRAAGRRAGMRAHDQRRGRPTLVHLHGHGQEPPDKGVPQVGGPEPARARLNGA